MNIVPSCPAPMPAKTAARARCRLIARFAAIVGAHYAITDPGEAPYLTEERGLFDGRSPLVLRPGSVDEVAAILKLANETATPLVPQGGNTGLVGGQTPLDGEVVLSLKRLDRIREVDPTSNTMTCEAGVMLATRRRPPPRPAGCSRFARRRRQLHHRRQSLDQCRRHRRARLRGRARARARARSGAGGRPRAQQSAQAQEGQYRLRPAAPVHRRRRHARHHHRGGAAAVPAPALGRDRLRRPAVARGRARAVQPGQERAGGAVTGFELIPRMRLELVLRIRRRLPRSARRAASLVCADRAVLAGARRPARRRSRIFWRPPPSAASSTDATIAASLDQAKAFWRCATFADAQKYVGGSIKHDVSVPVAAVPDFIARGERGGDGAGSRLPAAAVRPSRRRQHPFQRHPAGGRRQGAFLARWDEVNAAVFAVVQELGGSISAEHGIGVMKRELLPA